MNYDSNYPMMSRTEFENAPWNKETEEENIDAYVSYSISYNIPIRIAKNNTDSYQLREDYIEQYPLLEDCFDYLAELLKEPKNEKEKLLKHIAKNFIIDDYFVDFA